MLGQNPFDWGTSQFYFQKIFKIMNYTSNLNDSSIVGIYKKAKHMHMTTQSNVLVKSEPVFSYIPKKNLQKQLITQPAKTVLEVEYEIPDDQFFGEGKQAKEITQQIKEHLRQMIKNLPKLEEQERIPYQDVVFKNLQKVFKDRRSLPGSFIKAQKQPKDKLPKNERHRVSIQIPLENVRHEFSVQEKYYRHSDKNFEYDMRIIIKKIQNRPPVKDHPLKKYLTGRLSEFYL